MLSRRQFMASSAVAGLGVFFVSQSGVVRYVTSAAEPATLPVGDIPKFAHPVLIPPVMPRAGTRKLKGGRNADYYEISMRQVTQQILPPGLPPTTVWGYGAIASDSRKGLLLHNAPSLTIEAQWNRPVMVKWINDLKDAHGDFLPHLLPVDPTLHWANPPGGLTGRDTRPLFSEVPGPYTGPVPIVTHVHGAVGVNDDSDGYAEAWYLPDARNIDPDHAREGTWYDFFKGKAEAAYGLTAGNRLAWGRGYAVFTYPNLNRASTIWYHDHAIGMTRLNVYAGPAGFYLIRGGPDDKVIDTRTGLPAVLPGPAPKPGDQLPSNKTYFEIPLAIQDRTFNADGSLFYPDTRTFFDGVEGPYLGSDGSDAMSFSPIWNPEFFGNTMMVNGKVWPFLDVQQRRYRLRMLNGCDSRFLILDFSGIPGVEVWQVGNDGGFLPAPVNVTALGNRLLLALAERADLIVDFTNVPVGNHVLGNVGPDEPFGGGEPDEDFDAADPETTGQIMQFRVSPALVADPSTPPQFLRLPAIVPSPPATFTRPLALIEKMGMSTTPDPENPGGFIEGPTEAMLGRMEALGGTLAPVESMWEEPVSENPQTGATEVWEFYNTTGDAHPMHVHEVVFEVVNRERLEEVPGSEPELSTYALTGDVRGPEPGEAGWKDTVTAYPGEVTRVRATFTNPGQYVWHCHIVSHEDNEMMRPFRVGPVQPGQPKL